MWAEKLGLGLRCPHGIGVVDGKYVNGGTLSHSGGFVGDLWVMRVQGKRLGVDQQMVEMGLFGFISF